MPRFVILEHRWNGVHWDIMLQRGDSLRTWAIDEPIASERDLPARSLPDHRPVYLDYEGPVSGGRGVVTRSAAGVYETEEWGEDRVHVELTSAQLSGAAIWTRDARGAWSLRFVGKVD